MKCWGAKQVLVAALLAAPIPATASMANDWASGKLWYRDTTGLGGSAYPVHCFIYGPKARVSDELSSGSPYYVASLIDAYVR